MRERSERNDELFSVVMTRGVGKKDCEENSNHFLMIRKREKEREKEKKVFSFKNSLSTIVARSASKLVE